VGEETLFLPFKALPADDVPLVGRRNECIVMVHLAVTFVAADGRFFGDLWVN
jgi:hypothetical protein